MSLINSLENKFGRFAIPGLVGIIAWLQAGVWILAKANPEMLGHLILNKAFLMQGQIWRAATFVAVPVHANPLWMVFAVMLMLSMSATLDHAWGAFRVNLFILAGMIFTTAGVLLQSSPLGNLVRSLGLERQLDTTMLEQLAAISDFGFQCSYWFDSGIMFAFACVVPNAEIALYGILPFKVKYVALLLAAKLMLDAIQHPPLIVPMIFALMNFFIAFGPSFVRLLTHRGTVMQRRSRFESAKQPDGAFFHQCASCKKTELDDAKLEFRVTADGEEYCNVCRPKKAA